MQSLVPLRPGKFHVVVLVPFNGELVNESKMAPSSQNNARPQGTAHFKIFFFVVTQRTTLKTFFSLCVTTVRLHNFCTIPLDSSYSIYSHHSCSQKELAAPGTTLCPSQTFNSLFHYFCVCVFIESLPP